MSKHHIFFVHGMGSHTGEWIKDEGVEQLMEELWLKYPSLVELGSFDSMIECHSIHYNDIFQSYYEQWSNLSGEITNSFEIDNVLNGYVSTLVDAAEQFQEGEEKKEFFYTHAFDVILFRFSELVQRMIIETVSDQIFTIIKKTYKDTASSYSIVGHSMGSAVVNMVLQKLFNHKDYMTTLNKALKFDVLMQVSNTSYVLSRDRENHLDINHNIVYPSRRSSKGVCRKMINVNHKLDPVGSLIPFDPNEDWPNVNDAKNYIDIRPRISIIQDKNIHSLNHYLSNPKVHIEFFNCLFSNSKIPMKEREKAIKEYSIKVADSDFKLINKQLENIEISSKNSWRDYLSALTDFYKITNMYKKV